MAIVHIQKLKLKLTVVNKYAISKYAKTKFPFHIQLWTEIVWITWYKKHTKHYIKINLY